MSSGKKPGKTAGSKPISLALQGGGAHGAFTWGVIDQIVEDGRLTIDAISGTSAGAMNAVVFADGWLHSGADGARAGLERFWRSVSSDGRLNSTQRRIFDAFLGVSTFDSFGWVDFWTNFIRSQVSPYDFNPLNINPLKDFLEDEIDFGRVRACKDVRLFITATNVESGKAKVFKSPELTADHVMASACLPTLFQAVEIEGVPYWDGGYMGNPALYPLFAGTGADDILLVQINPVERKGTPTTPEDIRNRLNEITFNATLLRELRAIDFVVRLIEQGKLSTGEYKKILMHRIALSEALHDIEASSKLDSQWKFFVTLKDAGRAAARAWLVEHYDDIGRRATIDLRKEFG